LEKNKHAENGARLFIKFLKEYLKNRINVYKSANHNIMNGMHCIFHFLKEKGFILCEGVWPESESFREEPNLGPIPISWRGTCVKGDEFDPATACNRKLIGARFYLAGFELDYGPLNASGPDAEFRSPRDCLGHGTHTASTAVGSIVNAANYYGLGTGNARGGAPRARLAVYKICWFQDFEGR
jgi:Subtilase family